jgi:uncharacterized protein
MAHKGSKSGNGNKGFGSMDETRQREISSQGGKASAQSNTSNRGFASMNKDKQREISSLGGKASQSGSTRNQRGSTGRNEQAPSKDSERSHNNKIAGETDLSKRDLSSLEDEDEVVNSGIEDASSSETDEDEDEGVGDGNMGRSRKSLGSDEEG